MVYPGQHIYTTLWEFLASICLHIRLYEPDALSGFECAVCDDGVVADDGLARGQHLRRVVRVPHAIPETDRLDRNEHLSDYV